jgi:hypothetical protein
MRVAMAPTTSAAVTTTKRAEARFGSPWLLGIPEFIAGTRAIA